MRFLLAVSGEERWVMSQFRDQRNDNGVLFDVVGT